MSLRLSRAVLILGTLLLLAIVVVSVTAVRRSALPLVTSGGIPIPFGNSSRVLQGRLSQIGTTDAKTLVDVTFDGAESLQELPAQSVAFIVTPNSDSVLHGTPLRDVLTSGKRFYGYKYTSVSATLERQRREEQVLHPELPYQYSELFPGQFFASSLNDPFVIAFSSQHDDVHFLTLADVPLERNARYIIVPQEAGISMAAQVGCGNGIEEQPEVCDDGNSNGGDGCTDCQVDQGYTCESAHPTHCQPICGDGSLHADEQCDLGTACTGGKVCSRCQCTPAIPCIVMQGYPSKIAITPNGSKAYVVYQEDGLPGSRYVAVVSTASNTVTSTVSLDGMPGPYDIAVSPNGSKVFVTSLNHVTSINLISSVVRSIAVPTPTSVAVTPDSDWAYVTTSSYGNVAVIRTSDDSLFTSVPVQKPGESGYRPILVKITRDGLKAYVAHTYPDGVAVLDTATKSVTSWISLAGRGPVASLLIAPDGSKVYALHPTADSVSIIDTATEEVTPIAVGNSPFAMAMASDGSRIYVANTLSSTLSVIDTGDNTVVATVDVSQPANIAVTSDGSRVVTTDVNNSLSVIDTSSSTVIATVPMDRPEAVAITPDGSRAYVGNGTRRIAVVDMVTGAQLTACGNQ